MKRLSEQAKKRIAFLLKHVDKNKLIAGEDPLKLVNEAEDSVFLLQREMMGKNGEDEPDELTEATKAYVAYKTEIRDQNPFAGKPLLK